MPAIHKLQYVFLNIFASLCLAACTSLGVTPTPTASGAPPPTRTTLTVAPASPTLSQSSTLPPEFTVPPLVTTTAPTRSPAPAATGTGDQLDILQIAMIDSQNGWAVAKGPGPNDQILGTIDGGLTWTHRTPPEPPPETAGVEKVARGIFPDASHALVIYQNEPVFAIPELPVVWSTADAGVSWEASSPFALPEPPDFLDISDLQVTDSGTGFFLAHVGVGMNHDYLAIFRSDTTGAAWDRVADPFVTFNIQGCQKTGLAFADASLGWMSVDCQGVRDTPYYFESSDGGTTWENKELPPPADDPDLYTRSICGVYSPRLPGGDTGFLVLRCLNREDFTTLEGYLYRTGDGGQTWISSAYPGGDLLLLDQEMGFALSRDIFRTDDQGLTWALVKTVNWDGHFSFIDDQTGWAVARSGDAIALVRTANGGLTWQEINPIFE